MLHPTDTYMHMVHVVNSIRFKNGVYILVEVSMWITMALVQINWIYEGQYYNFPL